MRTQVLGVAGLAAVLLTGLAAAAGEAGKKGPETSTSTYYVGDFIAAPGDGEKPFREEDVEKRLQETEVALSPMIKLITTTTARGTWKTDGAAAGKAVGSITPFPKSHSLIVRQTEEGHREVQDLLRGLRELPAFKRPAEENR